MTRLGRLALVLAVAAGVIVAGCGAIGGGNAATVNGKAVTMSDYERQVKVVSDSMLANGLDPKSADGKATLDSMRGDILNQLVEMELVRQSAEKEGLGVSEADINERLAQVKDDVGGEDVYTEKLKEAGITDTEFRTQILPDQMLYERLYDKILADLPKSAEQVHSRHIMLGTEQDADAVLARLKTGEDFAAVAKELSLDTGSKDNGGDLGFAPRGVFDSTFEQVIFSLKVNEIGKVKTDYGWHVIQVLEHEANKELAADIAQSMADQAMTQYMNDAYSTSKIEILIKLPPTPTPSQ